MDSDAAEGWADGVHPDDRGECLEAYGNACDRREPFSLEYRLRGGDGRYRSVVDQGVPYFDADGNLRGFIGACYDVDEKKRAEEAIRTSRGQARELARAAAKLDGRAETHDVLRAACEAAVDALGVWAAGFLLVDDSGSVLYLAADHGLPVAFRARHKAIPRHVRERQLELSSPSGQVADVQRSADLPNAQIYASHGIRSVAYACASWEGRLLGSLVVYTCGSPRHFDDEELEFLQGLASLASQAIVAARLKAEVEQHKVALGMLSDCARRLAEVGNQRALAEQLARAAVEALGADLAQVVRLDADGTHQVVAATCDDLSDSSLAAGWGHWPEARDSSGRDPHASMPAICHDIAADERFLPWREAALARGLCCAAVFPLASGAQPLGALAVFSRKLGFFNPAKVDLFSTLAAQAAALLAGLAQREEAERSRRRVEALRNIDAAAAAGLDLRVTLDVALEQAMDLTRADAAAVLLLDPFTKTLQCATSRGFRGRCSQRSRFHLGDSFIDRAVMERRVIQVPNLADVVDDWPRLRESAGEAFVAYYAVPLVARGQVKGVLELFHRSALSLAGETLAFLECLATRMAHIVDGANLFEELERSNVELASAFDAAIEGWARTLDLRDLEPAGHTQRVVELTERLAREMGIGGARLCYLRWGALLHDIGLVGVPDSVRHKAGRYTPAEREAMRRHPLVAYDLMAPIAFLQPAIDIPYCHHERWNGSGYPRGLKGAQIPLAARIFAVVDVWDAMRHERLDRPALADAEVREHLRSRAGEDFDPAVVEAFFRLDL